MTARQIANFTKGNWLRDLVHNAEPNHLAVDPYLICS